MPNAICKPYIVGVAGGTGAGKTTLAHILFDHLGKDRAIRIPTMRIIAIFSYPGRPARAN